MTVRLSEKSIELNFCHQFSSVVGQPIWWFGATQKQENAAGWDVAGQVLGHWLLFQLKASRHVLGNGRRRFRGTHDQLVELQNRAVAPLSVFYVFPTIGTTDDLAAVGFDLLSNVRLMDVSTIGAVAPPTTKAGTPRERGLHYFDLDVAAHVVTIHSDPVDAPVLRADSAMSADVRGIAHQLTDIDNPQQRADQTREFLQQGRNRIALFIPA